MRGDRRPQPAALGAVVDQAAREELEVEVGVGLDLEHRRLPAVLHGLDDLVVPVGALDQPHGQRVGALRAGPVDPLDDRVQRGGRVAQVGLQDHARRRARAELLLREQGEDQLEHRVARVQRLHVDVQVRAELVRAAQQAAQPLRRVALAAQRGVGLHQRRERARPSRSGSRAGAGRRSRSRGAGARASRASTRPAWRAPRRSARRSAAPRPGSRSPRRAGRPRRRRRPSTGRGTRRAPPSATRRR